MTKIRDSIFYVLLYLLPKNLVSSLMGKLVGINWPIKINKILIYNFAKIFKINTEESEFSLENYNNIQDYFVRKLKAGLRPIDQGQDILVSPCDGFISQMGQIIEGKIIQIKQKNYKISDLLGSEELAGKFNNGNFITVYLAPRDYHRFHAPINGQISETIYLPGSLWPVNEWAVNNISDLFCLNERIISLISINNNIKNNQKTIAYIAVGATMVGKIKLEYCELETNLDSKPAMIQHEEEGYKVNKGQELGRFMFGSTIVMLFEPGLLKNFLYSGPRPIKMGEAIALINS